MAIKPVHLTKALKILLMTSAFPILCISQTLSGWVRDEAGKPIPYVNVVALHYFAGAVTDTGGYFELRMTVGDTLQFTHIAYQSQLVAISAADTVLNVHLQSSTTLMDEIVIKAPGKRAGRVVPLGYYHLGGNSSYKLGPGNQVAIWINNTQQKPGLIQCVQVKIADTGVCNGNIRLRIKRKDPSSSGPGEDILKENIIRPIHAIRKQLKIDVSEYHLVFPEDGVFIVVEWLYTQELCPANSYFVLAATTKGLHNTVWLSFMDKSWSRKPVSAYSNTPKAGLEVRF